MTFGTVFRKITASLVVGGVLLTFSAACESAEEAAGSEVTVSGDENEISENDAEAVMEFDLSESPAFSLQSGCYQDDITVELSVSGAVKEIRYTLDGSDPASSDTAIVYRDGIVVHDRAGEPNVVSAVPFQEIAPNWCKIDMDTRTLYTDIVPPADDEVDKCTVIRAVAVSGSGDFSEESNAVYFIGDMENHIPGVYESAAASGEGLAVISIAANYDDMFGAEKGIYVAGDKFADEYVVRSQDESFHEHKDMSWWQANYRAKGREWEREAAVTGLVFSDDGSCEEMFSQNCGIRIQGDYSRSLPQKSFRLYARDEYGKKKFKYPVFGEDYLDVNGEVMNSYKRLVLRSSCQPGGNPQAKFADALMQDMLYGKEMATQHTRPCVVYINGEYWGMYVLSEDYTKNYFANRYGVSKDDVIVYKAYGNGEYALDIGEAPEGEEDDYYIKELIDFLYSHDTLADEADYAAMCELVDPESVLDYFASELWLNNKGGTWPSKNWSLWRTKTPAESGAVSGNETGNEYGTVSGNEIANESGNETGDASEYSDGRWRYAIYDLDLAMSGVEDNSIELSGVLNADTSNPTVRMFALMMTNEGFKNEFKEKLLSLSRETFSEERVEAAIQLYTAEYGPLYDQFYVRYPYLGSKDGAMEEIDAMHRFLTDRYVYVWPMQDEL